MYFVWAGDGSLKSELQKAVEQLDAGRHIQLVGQVWNIKEWLNTSDMFILPSLAEGMPLSIMEAMACGVPVIASSVSGIPEELEDTGLLLPDPSIHPQKAIEQLYEVILTWTVDAEKRRNIGNSCRDRALRMFREPRMIEETLRILTNSCDGRPTTNKSLVEKGEVTATRPSKPDPIISAKDDNDVLKVHQPSQQTTIGKKRATPTYYVGLQRVQLLNYLPKKGRVAEIGVAEGHFSKEILARTEPAELHLIDPWEHQTCPEYQTDPTNVSNAAFQSRYQSIVDGFAADIRLGRVLVRREYSTVAAEVYADGYFDWIYLDAMHTFDSVYQDLKSFARTVKPEGIILGHDFTNHSIAERMNFGVIQAVAEASKSLDLELLLLTDEPYPTFALAKRASQQGRQFIALVLRHSPWVVEIGNFSFDSFTQKILTFKDGSQRVVSCF